LILKDRTTLFVPDREQVGDFIIKIELRADLVLIRSIPGIFQNSASLKIFWLDFQQKLAGLRVRWDFRESCPEVGWLVVPSSLPFFIRLQK